MFGMYLKQITTKNIQSHAEVVVDLPPTGLVVFTGQNSNGKSVIFKTTKKIISGELRKPRVRASLVNRNAMFGEISYLRSDDVRLTVHITREANTVYVKYEVPGKEPIIRYLADKTYLDLVHKFGWHYDEDSGISLNIAEEEDALLFYKTGYKTNRSVIETATSDSVANKVELNFQNTIKETRNLRDQWVQQSRTYLSAKQELKIEDIEPLKIKLQTYEKCLRNLQAVHFPVIPEIVPVPKVKFADVYIPNVPKIKYPKFINLCISIPEIQKVAEELNSLKNHKCPTCGRGFDCACENTIHS